MKMPSTKIAERAAQLLSLKGKVATVTGAASGIGRGISMRLAEMGAFVALLDINDSKGREAAAEIEAHAGEAVFLKGDVRSECRHAQKDRDREQEPAGEKTGHAVELTPRRFRDAASTS